jgi:hypothetical protein
MDDEVVAAARETEAQLTQQQKGIKGPKKIDDLLSSRLRKNDKFSAW